MTAWGNYPKIESEVIHLRSVQQAQKEIETNDSIISMGMARSYGDSALSQNIIITRRFNYILDFDGEQGIVTCESGVTLKDLLNTFVPKGWFLPVTPGTKYITVGGAIASDVHGKNHHREGTFCDHLLLLELLLPSGDIIICSPTINSKIFRATCGGNGLTGIILRATFQMKRIETAYIRQRTIKAKNLGQMVELLEMNENYTYTVAWIDCMAKRNSLGRGVLFLGEHAEKVDLASEKLNGNPYIIKDHKKLNVPIFFPNFVLNKMSIESFNSLYYFKFPKDVHDCIVDYDTFFYPLDSIYNWNRIYGKRGFTQYQLVIPKSSGIKGVQRIIKRVSDKKMGSFLAVLKIFGKANGNLLSFPREGYTLTLDFPINRSLFSFLNDLDDVVLEYGGRLYLTKDVRMSARMFRMGYPNWKKFVAIRQDIEADNKFHTLQSRRLGI